MSFIQSRIKDPTVLKLIRTGLKAKVFDNKIEFTPEIGSPQGSILSPLLSNIYLDKFDKFMKDLEKKYEGCIKPDNRQKSQKYIALMKSGRKKEIYTQRISRSNPFQSEYRFVKYIRYADDFLIGITGNRKLASEIKSIIKDFLSKELKLSLNEEKTHITHISKTIPFLGHLIGRNSYVIRQKYGDKIVNRRITIPTLYVNMKKVIARLAGQHFCDGNGNPLPNFRFLRLPQSESNKKINMILRGLCN